MIRTNEARLTCQSAPAKIQQMFVPNNNGAFMDADGYAVMMNPHGGINYTCRVGDNCMNFDAPLSVPGVCIASACEESIVKHLACAGDEVIITGGPAAGEKGLFTGKMFGEDLSSVYFPAEVLEKMTGEEHFLVKCLGTGLRLEDYPKIKCFNMAPALLHKLGVIENGDGTLTVPVTHVFPSKVMGEGWGNMCFCGDEIDISTDDEESYRKYDMASLRYGDVVMITDLDSTSATTYIQGACSIGLVVHGDASGLGYGPGFMVILSSNKPLIKAKLDPHANLAEYFGIGREG